MTSGAGTAGSVQSTVLVPVNVYGKTRLVAQTVSADAKDYALQLAESARVADTGKRRLYYDGEQYAAENLACAQAEGIDPRWQRLEEYKRRHAYSTQICECVDYLADRLGDGWMLAADDPAVQTVLDETVGASPQLSAEDEDGELTATTDDALREAMTCGDVAAYIGWDPVAQTTVIELWESEKVEFRWSSTAELDLVIRSELIWVRDVTGAWMQVVEHVQFQLLVNPAGFSECARTVYWGTEDTPQGPPEWLGVGVIPWGLLRAQAKGLRDLRGQAMITDQVMESADRLNAVLQNEYQISRYNSHGNLAVIGDAASLQVQSHSGVVHKDIADVLTFPGGTALVQISLVGDSVGTAHQESVLKDSILGSFGLVRVDPETWSGLGAVSGYALEILNTKTESTFRRVRRQWRKDWTSLTMLVLDVTAWRRDAPTGYLLDGVFHPVTAPPQTELAPELAVPVLPPGAVWTQAWWEVVPDLVFPNRKVEVKMGSGYIVDDVKNRDDFIAGLVSQRWALRARGLSDDQIDEIQAQQDEEKPVHEASGVFGGIAYAPAVAELPGTAAGVGTPSGTAAGVSLSQAGA
jgi:hypothetical protein